MLTRKQVVAEHFNTTGTPVGHGFTAENKAKGTAYYTFDKGLFRGIVLDTVNPNGYAEGSLGTTQMNWLKTTLADSKNKYVDDLQPPHVRDDDQPTHRDRPRSRAAGARPGRRRACSSPIPT